MLVQNLENKMRQKLLFYRIMQIICRAEFKRDLEADVVSETSGNFRNLLVSQVNAHREEGGGVDPGRAAADAKTIYDVRTTPSLLTILTIIHKIVVLQIVCDRS